MCRAGATTLAELTAAGRAAILIPLPTATDDHQRRNAEALVRQGAARVVDQRDLTPARLAEEVLALAGDASGRERDGGGGAANGAAGRGASDRGPGAGARGVRRADGQSCLVGRGGSTSSGSAASA